MIADFSVPGEPVTKSRARHTKAGYVYTPRETVLGMGNIAWWFRKATIGYKINPEANYIVCCVYAVGTMQRRDVDNMDKIVLDALNGVAWVDDRQVVGIHSVKVKVPKDQAEMRIRVYATPLTIGRFRTCKRCGKKFTWYPSLPNREYCCGECLSADRRDARTFTCEECGSKFERTPGAKARYCSRECREKAGHVDVTCYVCGKKFTKQKCHLRERNFCSPRCQQEYIRPIRAKRARGVCVDCGGPTSKKSYTRCRACNFRYLQEHKASHAGSFRAVVS